jgi:hypothetical protein
MVSDFQRMNLAAMEKIECLRVWGSGTRMQSKL